MKATSKKFEDFDFEKEYGLVFDDDDDDFFGDGLDDLDMDDEDVEEEDEEAFDEDEEEEPAPKKKKKPKKQKVKKEKPKKVKKVRERDGTGLTTALGILSLVLLAALICGALLGMKKIKELEGTQQTSAVMEQEVYVTTKDVRQGDEIIFAGSEANVALETVYVTDQNNSYIINPVTGFAIVDIPAGTPLTNIITDNEWVEPVVEPETIVETVEVPAQIKYEIPHNINATFVDKEGTELAFAATLNLEEGIEEEALRVFAADIDGYMLQSIKMGDASVHSIGALRKATKDGDVYLYYITDASGLNRTEITEDIDIVYTYDVVPQSDITENSEPDVTVKGVSVNAPPEVVENVIEDTEAGITYDEILEAQEAEVAAQ